MCLKMGFDVIIYIKKNDFYRELFKKIKINTNLLMLVKEEVSNG